MFNQIKNYILSMLNLVGSNPLQINFVSRSINAIIFIITAFTFTLLCLNIRYEEFSMNVINDLVDTLPVLFEYLMKQLTMLKNASLLCSLFNDIDAFWPTTATSEEKCRRECNNYLKLTGRFIKGFRWYASGCMLCYATEPFFSSSLAMPVYQPDFLPETVFFIINGLTFALDATVAITFDVVAFYFIAVAHVQFKLLNSRIRNLNLLKAEDECKAELAELIQHQDFLYKNVAKINDAFTYTFLADLVLGTILFWFQIFMVLGRSSSGDNFLNKIKRVTFSSGLIAQFCLYCLPATLLDEDNEELMVNIYSTKWYECESVSIGKILIIMMQRAQKKTLVTAGYFIPLNLETLKSVLKNGFSFYTMLSLLEDKLN